MFFIIFLLTGEVFFVFARSLIKIFLRRVLQLWPRRKDADCLFLHYEEFLTAPRANIKLLDAIVHDTSFDAMKARPLVYDMLRKPTATKFLRAGKAGEGRVAFSAEQVRCLMQILLQ